MIWHGLRRIGANTAKEAKSEKGNMNKLTNHNTFLYPPIYWTSPRKKAAIAFWVPMTPTALSAFVDWS